MPSALAMLNPGKMFPTAEDRDSAVEDELQGLLKKSPFLSP
jgi:hypothetical protein